MGDTTKVSDQEHYYILLFNNPFKLKKSSTDYLVQMKEIRRALRCLTVDDQYDFSLTFSEILKSEGFDAEYTTSAKEALEMISRTNYDFIFLDVNMPEISGIEMLNQIPEISKNQPKCIMVTGYSDSEIILSALNAGAAGYLVKPIELEKLNQIITKIQNTLQKNQDIMGEYDFSHLTSKEKKIIEKISNSPDNQIRLEFTDIDPIFPGLDTIDNWIEVMNILNELTEKGFIKREERDRVILCPSCYSVETYSRYLCPSCKSIKIDRLNLIQHLNCGHMEHKKEVLGKSDYLCPKCLPKTHNQEEYKIIGIIFECSECGSKFNRPNISHFCKKCDEFFDYNNSRYTPIYNYSTDDSIKKRVHKTESNLTNEENNVKLTKENAWQYVVKVSK
jgi:CheY-like chemotaxis protein/ribosomal protein L37AE/L43A